MDIKDNGDLGLDNLDEDKIRNIKAQVTRIENDTLKLLKANGVSQDKIKANKDLISQYAFLRALLKDLSKFLAKYGVKEVYLNGRAQFGYKARVEAKSYNDFFKSFIACKRALNDILFAGADDNPLDDGFDEDDLE